MRAYKASIREDRPFYNIETPRWWVSNRQRVVILEFETPEDAERWDHADQPWEQLRLW